MNRLKQFLKRFLFGQPGRRRCRIPLGLQKGLNFFIDPSIKSQRLLGLDEREISSVLRRLSGTAKTAVDIGASDGWYALYFASQANVEEVIAVEPSLDNCNCITENLAANPVIDRSKLRILPMLAGDVADANCTTLDRELSTSKRPILIKVDVDGAETHVLRGARETLSGGDCFVVVETHSVALEAACIDFLEGLGYRCRIIKNAWYRTIIPEQRVSAQNRWLVAEPTAALELRRTNE